MYSHCTYISFSVKYCISLRIDFDLIFRSCMCAFRISNETYTYKEYANNVFKHFKLKLKKRVYIAMHYIQSKIGKVHLVSSLSHFIHNEKKRNNSLIIFFRYML